VVHTDLAKELVIEPKATKLALAQEVRDFGGATVRVFTDMLDERMLVPVVLEGQHEVRSDGTGGMQDPDGGLPMRSDFGVRDDLGRNDFRDRADHALAEGVEIEERIDLCDARTESPNVPLG